MEEHRRPDEAELERLQAAVAAKGGRTMVRSEVLGWNRRWSEADREILVRHLGRVGAARFRGVADESYIRCLDAQDRIAMVIAPGYLTFPRHWVNAECAPDWPGIALSTFGQRSDAGSGGSRRAGGAGGSGGGRSGGSGSGSRAPGAPRARAASSAASRKAPEKAPAFCPRCFLQLTTTGACPSCD
ncbi:MAG: hypothetical protein Q4F65_08445 [Propionibacteriaceae bacterium]|nr:hypothetical protein [Propionibacteriaceae bacterium]